MGVAGSGKTTIGSQLAEQLGWPFYEGDDFHPPENVAKMKSGVPLTDADREPWLQALADLIRNLIANNNSAVLTCSALKSEYRRLLKSAAGARTEQVRFVYLRISPSVAEQRLRQRKQHFMPAGLAQSQFQTLEEPDDAVAVDATLNADEAIAQIKQSLGLGCA